MARGGWRETCISNQVEKRCAWKDLRPEYADDLEDRQPRSNCLTFINVLFFRLWLSTDFPQNAYKIRLKIETMKMSKQIQHSQGCEVNLSHTSLWKGKVKSRLFWRNSVQNWEALCGFVNCTVRLLHTGLLDHEAFETYIEKKKKNPSLINPIRPHSTLILGCFTEPPAWGRRRGPPAVIPQISCSNCVGWSTTGSAACWFVQASNVLLDAASLWFTSLNVRLADRSNYWWRVLRRLGPQTLKCLRGRGWGGGRSGDLHVRVNLEWQPDLSHFNPWMSSVHPAELTFPSGPDSAWFP